MEFYIKKNSWPNLNIPIRFLKVLTYLSTQAKVIALAASAIKLSQGNKTRSSESKNPPSFP